MSVHASMHINVRVCQSGNPVKEYVHEFLVNQLPKSPPKSASVYTLWIVVEKASFPEPFSTLDILKSLKNFHNFIHEKYIALSFTLSVVEHICIF